MAKFRQLFVAVFVLLTILNAHLGYAATRHRAELAFVANQSSNNISAYQISSNGGLLPLAGSPFAAGNAPNSIAVVPSGTFMYVANVVSGDISGYSVSQTGALSPLPGSPFPASTGSAFLTIDPSGRFLYALNCGSICSSTGSGAVLGYTIDQHTGALTPMSGSPFSAGQFPFAMAVEATGHFAYVANYGSGDVYAYTIDGQTGALTQNGLPIASGTRPLSVASDPWGQFIYVANTGSNNVSVFGINFDGSLHSVNGSPFTVGNSVAAVTASRSGQYIIVAASAGAYVYQVASTGALHLTAPPVAAGTGPNAVSIDPTDSYAYVVNGGSANVSAYGFNAQTGKLTPVTGSPFAAGAFAAAVSTAPVPTHQ